MVRKLIVLAATFMPITAVHASPFSQALCEDQVVEHAASQAISEWSQNYPFAKVIIGSDGKFGEVLTPEVSSEAATYIVCRGSYQLVKAAPDGHPYTVRIPAFLYRIAAGNNGYQVTLEDLPNSLGGSSLTSRDLLSRFTIDGRPYLDVLEENRRRFAATQTPPDRGEKSSITSAIPEARAADSDCANAGSNMDVTDCLAAAYGRADKALNQTYKKTVVVLQKFSRSDVCFHCGSSAKLAAAQRAWMVWRDRECDLLGSQLSGGSGQRQLELDCLIRLTNERTAQVRGIAAAFHS